MAEINTEKERLTYLRDKLLNGLMEAIPYAKLNGPRGDKRLPNNVNISSIGVEGETLLFDLNDAGIYVSTGSACASGSLEPSHVLLALGLKHEVAHGSLRLTLGESTTEEQVDYALKVIPKVVARRRAMSPFWDEYLLTKEAK